MSLQCPFKAKCSLTAINAGIDTHALNRFCMAELINGAHTSDEKGAAVNIDVFSCIIKLLFLPTEPKVR